ncbi:sarcosine oxidase subunit delta [Bradyrhizobium sp. CCGUVB23]|uniref:sarcosine oxidase subunit delta n=1 Tax=Bradyrhizobium sp. CCGUVB23 TaxID=2949630 RepID=UPI0020B2917C|nr:sarcosine oxidase subunit delta [Bradyrhizobium sp. CCGUVB23]MCP3463535.1 sarcosine oxidase subunit delta [Bradyrhizobium sp. CCGUVB23]
MRINCPHCGTRSIKEFVYLGDATKTRPDGLDASPDSMFEYVYIRDNPAGPHDEYWYHDAGCHAWLVVTRNTRTHEILNVQTAQEVAHARKLGVDK